MNNRRRFLGCMLAATLCGCGGDQASTAGKPSSGPKQAAATPSTSDSPIAMRASGKPQPMRVVCSFFPIYLFTKNVVGDVPVSVELLLPASKGCPHGYDLKPSEVAKVVEANVVVLNGGGLETFDEKKIKGALKSRAAIIDCCKGLKLLEADDEHDHDHDHKPGEAHHHHHDHGKNPHCFSSPEQAAKQVQNIAEGLAAADPANADAYRKNGEAYAAKLAALGAEFKSQLAGVASKKIVTMHEAFDYLAKDAGLEIVGELQSGEGSELKPAEAKKLVDAMKKDKVPAVFREPQYPAKTANLIAKEAGAVVELLDPVASGPDDAGKDYYEKTMRQNLATLLKVLGKK